MADQNDFEKAMKYFGKHSSGGKGVKLIATIVIIIAGLAGVMGSFYTVKPDEEAVVLRLGKYYGTFSPGLHFKIPFGIDKTVIMKTKSIHQAEFGFRTLDTRGSRTRYSSENYDEEALMLTGDLNVAEVAWVVLYRISDPFKVLFQAKDPVKNIRDVSESIMRRVVGDKLVNEVLTTGRVAIGADAKQLIQEVLDRYDIGIQIESIKLQDVNPPGERVKAAFNEVNEAKQEQEKLINKAEEAYNKVIPQARGEAEQAISQAQGYAEAVSNRARGDAQRFTSVLREYQRAPSITRKRLYLDTMEEVFKRFEKLTIVDSKVKGLLPVFNNKVLKE